MSDLELRQFKTTSGEEVVCEVVQWGVEHEDEILVRAAMRLVLVETDDGIKYYSFRPWMVYQEHPDDLMIMNVNNVVGTAYPPETLLVQYHEAVTEMAEMNASRELEYNQTFSEKAQTQRRAPEDKIDKMLHSMDSGSNVIKLFGGDPEKVH